MKDNLSKRDEIFSLTLCLGFFVAKEPFKRGDVQQKQFLGDLSLSNFKNHLPLQFVENNWLKIFSMHLCPRIVFPSRIFFSYELLIGLVEKIKQLYVLPTLIEC
jgi:hypothetical protein